MQDINLIPEELKKQKERAIQIKRAFVGTLAFLIVSVVLSLSLLVYKSILVKSLRDVNSDISAEEQKIASLKSMESKMGVLGEKLVFIQEVLDSRPSYSKLLNGLGSILPSGVYLTDIAVSSGDKAAIGGVTPSYSMLSELVGNVFDNSSLSGSIFERSEVTSVDLKEETNRIEFSMNIYLKKGALSNGIQDN